MKRILIVNNNMKVGGVQKSLCNLLWLLAERDDIEVTLVLFRAVGEYMERLPQKIQCVEVKSLFRYLGQSQGEMKGINVIKRGALAAISRIFGRRCAVKLMLLSQPMLEEHYDCAIAFLHNGRNSAFYGGVQDFVLARVHADRKITCLHDDYEKCGANEPVNNRLMAQFDAIAACSDGCRGVFEALVPELAYKSVTVRNSNNIEEIRTLAEEDTVAYAEGRIHVLCASRMSPRKGIDRAIVATEKMLQKGIPVTLHLLGNGVMEETLKNMVAERSLEEYVRFYGAQANPYRFMKNADLFLLPSFHEAAPMVIDEAYILGVPVLTTRTNSSDEMVTSRDCGWVCENSQEALDEMMYDILRDVQALRDKKQELRSRIVDNSLALAQFMKVIEG